MFFPFLQAPEIKVPELKAPDVKVPEFSAQDIKVPDIKIPSFGAISVPKFEAPDTSALPKVDTSKLTVPSFGSSVENKVDLEPQEVRDEKAVEAKKKFVDLDLKAQVRLYVLFGHKFVCECSYKF